MRVLVEILHPAHVHVFRNAIHAWRGRGDNVLVLSRAKECANDLLAAYDIPFKSISAIGRSKASLMWEMIVRDARMLGAAVRFKPDILIGVMGVTIAQVGKLIRKPAIVFYDTENAKITNRFVYPMVHSVCTPSCYNAPVRGNHVTYPGYHELAYLHPNRFTPDPEPVKACGLDPDKGYYLLRFVSWQASHDIGEAGLSAEFKRSLVARLSSEGPVVISSEGPLPVDLEKNRLSAQPEVIHHLIAHARMVVGESATMASEAAVLGVPAIYISDTGRGYTDEEERDYGLVFNFTTLQSDQAVSKVEQLLAMPALQQEFQKRREKMLAEKIDTTEWMLNYIDKVVGEKDNV